MQIHGMQQVTCRMLLQNQDALIVTLTQTHTQPNCNPNPILYLYYPLCSICSVTVIGKRLVAFMHKEKNTKQ